MIAWRTANNDRKRTRALALPWVAMVEVRLPTPIRQRLLTVGGARNRKDLSPEDWLLRYMDAEVDCVAITDHNNGEWIDKLKRAYMQMKERSNADPDSQKFP